MPLDVPKRSWRRGSYLVSTDLALVQVDEVNRVFASDVMWWAQSLPRDVMVTTLGNSLCFGLYEVGEAEASAGGGGGGADGGRELESPKNLVQVGFARLITDGATFAWMTDVYVLPEHQGKGLARFMMDAVKDVISEWTHLRRFMLITVDAMDLYRKTLGVKDWRELEANVGCVGVWEGPAEIHPHPSSV